MSERDEAKISPRSLIVYLWGSVADSEENSNRCTGLAEIAVNGKLAITVPDCGVASELGMLVEGLNKKRNSREKCNIYFDTQPNPKIGKLYGHSGLLTEYVIYSVNLAKKLEQLESMPAIRFHDYSGQNIKHSIGESVTKETALLMAAAMMLRQRYRATHTNDMSNFSLCLDSWESLEKITDPRFRIIVDSANNYVRLIGWVNDFDSFVIARWIASLCQNPLGISVSKILAAINLSPGDVGIK